MVSSTLARRSPWQARVILGLIIAIALFCVAITLLSLKPAPSEIVGRGAGDVDLYRAKIDRVHAGEGYYEAALAEMTARGYPTRSVFNWRTPLPIWLIGHLPAVGLGKVFLGLLALLLIVLAFEAVARDTTNSATGLSSGTVVPGRSHRMCRSRILPILTVLLLTGPLLFTVLGDLFVMPVLWAGVLLTLSLCAYGIGRSTWGVAFGLAAVFVRELALLYALVAVAIAVGRRQRRELSLWIIGLAVWALLWGLHAWHAGTMIPPEALAHRQGWIQCGGLDFVLGTVQINAYLILLPRWLTALYFMAAMIGFAGWNSPLGRRMAFSACAFLTVFGFVGQDFNLYWGSLIAPLMCFGAARFPFALGDLWRAAEIRHTRKNLHDSQSKPLAV